jgi:hypothetical protein
VSHDEPQNDSGPGSVGDSTDSPVSDSAIPASSSETETSSAPSASATTPDTEPEQPAVDETSVDEPASDEPAIDEPAVDEPVADVSGADEAAAAAQPADPDPVVDAIVAGDPATGSAQDTAESVPDKTATDRSTEPTTGGSTEPGPAADGSTEPEPGADVEPDNKPAAEDATEPADTAVATGSTSSITEPETSEPAGEEPTVEQPAVAESTADLTAPIDTAGEQPGGDAAPAPNDDPTTQFAAVAASAPTSPAIEDPPIGSPADENKTEVIASAAGATEVIDAPTERISTTKAAPAAAVSTPRATPGPTSAPAQAAGWNAEPAAPQYIPPAGGTTQSRPASRPKKSRKGLWFGLAALVVIIAVVAAVIGVLATGGEEPEVPADVAAERALEYTTALRDGDIITLRQITCGEAQQRFTTMSDQEFAEDHRIQQQNNELVGVDGVKASKIVNDGNGAVVEVVAYKTLTPNEKLDVALTLSKIDGEWKVCKA